MGIKSIIVKIKYFPSKVRNVITLKRKNVQQGKYVVIKGTIFITGQGRIVLGDNVHINSCRAANPIGGDTKTVFNTFDSGRISIGKNSGISNSALIARKSITVGNNVMIGGSTQIFDNDFHSLSASRRSSGHDDDIVCKPVTIEDGVFIGARCIILKGVTIGKNSVIGAGSVVSCDIPENEIWAGNPARFIRKCPE